MGKRMEHDSEGGQKNNPLLQKDGSLAFRFLQKTFWICFIVTLACIFLACSYTITVLMAVVLLGVGLVIYTCYRFEIPRFSLILFLLSMVVTIFCAVIIDTPIENDFGVQYDAAVEFANGNYEFGEEPYFQFFPFQTGLVVVEGLLLKIWNNPFFLRLVNCLLTSGINVLIYWIAREFFDRKASQCAAVCHLFFLFPAIFVAVLSNQPYSAFFIYLGLFFLVTSRFIRMPSLLRYAVAALFIAVGNAIRPEGLILLVPVAAYFVFAVLKKISWSAVFHYLKRAVVFFGVYFLLTALISNMIIWTGISSAGLENRAVYWKFVVGLNYDSSGQWNPSDEAIKEEILFDKAASLEMIRERLTVSPVRLAELFYKKIGVFWWDTPNQYFLFSLQHVASECPTAHAFLLSCTHALYFWVLVLAAVGFLTTFKKSRENLKYLLIPFMIFTTFMIYLIIEVQIRYSYIIHPAVFILAAGGIQTCRQQAVRLRNGKAMRNGESEKHENSCEGGESPLPGL